jgi:hypothetical protein
MSIVRISLIPKARSLGVVKRAVITRYDLRVFMYRKTSIGPSLVGVSRGTPDEKIHNYDNSIITASRPDTDSYTYKV